MTRKMTGVNTLSSYSLLLALILSGSGCGTVESPKQRSFPSAEDAVVAMVDALKSNDQATLVAIFGSEAGEALNSGDEVADQRGRDLFIAAYYERCVLDGDERTRDSTNRRRGLAVSDPARQGRRRMAIRYPCRH